MNDNTVPWKAQNEDAEWGTTRKTKTENKKTK
jgi:hypothetical protein